MVHTIKKTTLKEKEKCKLVRYNFLPVSLGKIQRFSKTLSSEAVGKYVLKHC